MKFDLAADELMNEMTTRKILPGVDISDNYPELGNVMLVCATETKTDTDLQTYADLVAELTKK
jgi:glycine dehydrogenase subunit 1